MVKRNERLSVKMPEAESVSSDLVFEKVMLYSSVGERLGVGSEWDCDGSVALSVKMFVADQEFVEDRDSDKEGRLRDRVAEMTVDSDNVAEGGETDFDSVGSFENDLEVVLEKLGLSVNDASFEKDCVKLSDGEAR